MPSELQELVDSAWEEVVDSAWEEVILFFIICIYDIWFNSVTCWAKQSSTCWCQGNIVLLLGRLCSFEICWHVQDMLDQVGIKLPNHKVRDVVQDLKNKGETEGEFLSKSGFEKVNNSLRLPIVQGLLLVLLKIDLLYLDSTIWILCF